MHENTLDVIDGSKPCYVLYMSYVIVVVNSPGDRREGSAISRQFLFWGMLSIWVCDFVINSSRELGTIITFYNLVGCDQMAGGMLPSSSGASLLCVIAILPTAVHRETKEWLDICFRFVLRSLPTVRDRRLFL